MELIQALSKLHPVTATVLIVSVTAIVCTFIYYFFKNLREL